MKVLIDIDEILSRRRNKNLLTVTLDEEEAEYLLGIVTALSGGEELTDREQLILLLGVRFMLQREKYVTDKLVNAAAEMISENLFPPQSAN